MASVTKNADKFYKYRRRIFELIRKIYDTGCYDKTLVDLIIADKKAEQTTVYHFDPRQDVQSQLEEIRKRTENNAKSASPDFMRYEIFIDKGNFQAPIFKITIFMFSMGSNISISEVKSALILDKMAQKTYKIDLPEEFQDWL